MDETDRVADLTSGQHWPLKGHGVEVESGQESAATILVLEEWYLDIA